MTRVERILIFVVVSGLAMPAAHAQSASAEALFREGRRLIKQGKLEAGCQKIEASEKLESSVGTLLNLGDCREKLGHPSDAWAAFRKAEAMAKRDGNDKRRQQEARRRALALESQLAGVTIQVGPKSRGEGLVIKRDGEAIDPDVWGTPLIVDPGSHTIVAEAPGKQPWRTDVSIGRGGRRWVVVPTLQPVAEARPSPPPAPPPVVVTPAPQPRRPEPVAPVAIVHEPTTVVVHPTWNTTRTLAVGLGVAGAAALGAGLYFGARANDLEARADAICPTMVCSDPDGLAFNDRAQSAASHANLLFLGGGVAVAAATVMWFVGAPGDETVVAPSVGETHVGAAVTGRF